MNDVQATWNGSESVFPVEGAIPRLTHMLFQGMFFIITPALIVGAFAERMKFSTMVVFMILWGTLVYCPLCHWVWDSDGILSYGGKNAGICAGGALDFAGGTVVHISSGISALVCALLIGRRLGHGSEPMPPHNMTFTVIGTALLWVGWFGFNAGSALKADNLAASAFAATHFAAATGAVAWACMEWLTRGKPSVLGACSGAVAGLVCITPGSGFVQPMSGILIGLAAGVCCFFMCTAVKSKFGYDDSLDVFGVHGIGGTLGAILTGVFATRAVNDMADGKRDRPPRRWIGPAASDPGHIDHMGIRHCNDVLDTEESRRRHGSSRRPRGRNRRTRSEPTRRGRVYFHRVRTVKSTTGAPAAATSRKARWFLIYDPQTHEPERSRPFSLFLVPSDSYLEYPHEED